MVIDMEIDIGCQHFDLNMTEASVVIIDVQCVF